MCHDDPEHVGRCAGPRSTRSPTKIALAAVGGRDGDLRVAPRHRVAELREQRLELVEAAVDVADDVERPVIARGGRSRAAARDDLAASTSSSERRTWTWRKPSRFRPRSERCELLDLLADDVRRRTPGRAALGVAGVAERLGQVEARSRPPATCYLRASATSGLPRLGLDVGRVDHGERRRREPLADEMCSTSNASPVAVWSVSSSETRPRQRSDETTSVGRKCCARERRLAGAGRADEQDERRIRGSRSSCATSLRRVAREHRHLCRRAVVRVLGADPPGSAPRSRSRRRRSRPRPELGAGPFEAMVAVAQVPGRQGLEQDVVFAVGRRHDHVPAAHGRTARARTPGGAAGPGARSPRSRPRRRSLSAARRDRSASPAAARSAGADVGHTIEPEPIARRAEHRGRPRRR